jgi:hypothetical protein
VLSLGIAWFAVIGHKLYIKHIGRVFFGLFTIFGITFWRFGGSDVFRLKDLVLYSQSYSQLSWVEKLLGIGFGQYPHFLAKNIPLEIWQYEPVHNTFLLVFIELGWLPILALIVWYLTKIWKNRSF